MIRKLAVVAEVLAVFFAGTLAARALQNALGGVFAPSQGSGLGLTPADAVAIAASMLLRWGLVIALALAIGRWAGGHRPRDYGLTLAGRSFAWHLRAGIVTLAFAFLPVAALLLARHFLGLPGGPALWDEIARAPRALGFWLVMLAGSIVIPPLVEETFFRGYAQTRFASAYRPATAILTVAALFVAAHTQYLDGSLVGTLMVPLMLWQVSVLGLARWSTGSLLAPVLAHAIGNIPMRPGEQGLFAGVLLAIVAWMLIRRRDVLRRAVTLDAS